MKLRRSLSYLLGENSVPHITICQIELNNVGLLASLWNACLPTLNNQCIDTAFQVIDLRLGSSEFNTVQWVSLIPSSKELSAIHQRFLKMMQNHGVDCLNAHG